MLEGAAVNELITGVTAAGGGGTLPVPLTVSKAVDLVEPYLLLAVRIYVVVVIGATFSAPAEGPEGIPGSIIINDAFSTSHDNMEASPGPMVDGLTVNFTTCGALLLPPPRSTVTQPAAASKRTRPNRIAFLIFSPPRKNILSHLTMRLMMCKAYFVLPRPKYRTHPLPRSKPVPCGPACCAALPA
jgi:hypothetical protein